MTTDYHDTHSVPQLTTCPKCENERQYCECLRVFDVFWAPEGRKIATVHATGYPQACRLAPMPYRKYLGEIYAVEKH